MPTATTGDVPTEYQVCGEGAPVLMFSPGGFDARMGKWTELGVYSRTKLLENLSATYKCIIFDRRENGKSGGRVEPVGWSDYARQGAQLLDHLEISSAHLLGGCMGCGPAAAFATTMPERTRSVVFFWPVGGARYRMNAHMRFARHLVYAEQEGLRGVVDLARSHDKNFSADPRCGPWVQCIRNSEDFAKHYVALDPCRYALVVTQLYRGLFDRDTVPGAEPEALLSLSQPCLIIPGADHAHSTAAAHYLHECVNGSVFVDIPADDQNESNIPERVLKFLQRAEG